MGREKRSKKIRVAIPRGAIVNWAGVPLGLAGPVEVETTEENWRKVKTLELIRGNINILGYRWKAC